MSAIDNAFVLIEGHERRFSELSRGHQSRAATPRTPDRIKRWEAKL